MQQHSGTLRDTHLTSVAVTTTVEGRRIFMIGWRRVGAGQSDVAFATSSRPGVRSPISTRWWGFSWVLVQFEVGGPLPVPD
jgi:hypothetical protein